MRQLTPAQLIDLQQDLERSLSSFAAGQLRDAFGDVGEPAVYDAAASYVTRPSKRLLGMAFLVAYYAFAGQELARHHLLPVATALEVRHAAILLHDDIVDGDQTRGGHPTAHHALTGTALGTEGAHAALFAGDVLAALTPLPVLRSDLPAAAQVELADAILVLTAQVGAGQIEQLRLDTTVDLRAVDQDAILRVHGTHFHAYLGCSLRLACALADLTSLQTEAVYQSSLWLARGFQVQNDLAGLTELHRHLTDGDPNALTMANTSDLGRRRRTTVVRAALDYLQPEDADRLAAYIDGAQDDIGGLVALIVGSGAIEHCHGLIDGLFDQAHTALLDRGLGQRHETAAQAVFGYLTDLYDPASEISRLYLQARPDLTT